MAVTGFKAKAIASRIFALLMSLLLLACDSLVVRSAAVGTRDPVLAAPSLDDEGHLNLVLKNAINDNSYDVYRLSFTSLPETFTGIPLQSAKPVDYALLETVDKTKRLAFEELAASAEKIGSIQRNETFIVPDELQNHSYYVFFIKLQNAASSHLITQVNLDDVSAVFGESSDTVLNLSWAKVAGARTYDIVYQSPTRASDSTTEAGFKLDPYDDTESYDLCVKARAGSLVSDSCTPFTLGAKTSRAKAIEVSSLSPDGFYKAADVITLTVKYSEPVKVDSANPPALLVKLDNLERNASYVSGSETDTLSFELIVADGMNTADLEALKILDLGQKNALVDAKGVPASLVLPALGSGHSLADQRAIVIDTTAPSNPSDVEFSSTTLSTLSFPVSFGVSHDDYLKEHEVKICQSQNCSTSCGTLVVTNSSPVTMSGPDNTDIYACVRARDEVGNFTPWIASSASSHIDTLAAHVNSVTSTTPNGSYKVGDSIALQVNFSDTVTVTNALDLRLKLATGNSQHSARYASGSGTTTLDFVYTVQAGDTSEDLNYASIAALTGGATGTIKGSLGSLASLTLPALTAPEALATAKAIVLDTTSPLAPSSLGFASAESSNTAVALSFSPGTDTHLSTHNLKLCTANDCATSCISATTGLTSPQTLNGVNGTSYYGCMQSVDTAGNLSAWVSSLNPVKIDTTAPTVSSVTSSTANGQYKAGATVAIAVTFSEPVVVTNGSNLGFLVETGATDRNALYTSGSGSDTLIFTYTVLAGDNSSLLEAESLSALTLGGSGTIKDVAGNNANRTLPALGGANSLSGTKTLVIDTTIPAAPSVINFAQATSSATTVDVSWTNATDLNLKQHNLKLCTASNCSTSCVGNKSKDASPSTLTAMVSGTYYACVQGEDIAGNQSAFVASASPIVIDNVPPTVTNVSSSQTDGSYKAGAVLPIRVTFNEAVTVTNEGDLSLTLETGASDAVALYDTGSGSNVLTFLYTVSAGEGSNDLEAASTSALSFGATGTIKDAAGNTALLTLPALAGTASLSGQKTLIIDTTAPTNPSSVAFAASVTNNTTLPVSFTAGTDAHLRYHRAMLCASNDCSTSCLTAVTGTSPINLTGVDGSTYYACVQGEDLAGNVSSWIPSSGTIQVDTTPPSITNASSSTPDGHYKTGSLIDISLTYSEPVTVLNSSALVVTLETGSTDRTAAYVSGSGSSILHFQYTVLAGDSSEDLEFPSTTPLTLSGATIRDAAGNNAVSNLTISGGASLSGQKAIVIDTTAPGLATAIGFSGSVTSSTSVPVNFTASPDAHLSTHNVKLCTANDCQTNCTAVTTGLTSPQSVTGLTNTNYYACVQGQDLAGNTSAFAASSALISIDSTAPTVSSVTSTAANGVYKSGDTLDISVNFNEAVALSGTDLAITLETGATDAVAPYTSGSGTSTLHFTYTVGASDASSDLNYEGTSALVLNSGTLEDLAGNTAVLTLPAPASVESLAGQKALVIDSSAPQDPSSVSFTTSSSNTLNLTVAWSAAAQGTYFDTYEVKACTDPACGTCTTATNAALSPKTITVTADGDYYACVRSLNKNGSASAWISSIGTSKVDRAAPTISSISSPTADGVYKEGSVITLEVNFSETVFVVDTSSVKLNLSPAGASANYVSGSGSATLTFAYTVGAGQTSSDLDISGSSALVLQTGSATIKDAAGNNANITTTVGSLSGAKALIIDTTAPTAPTSVGWSVPTSNTTSNSIAWGTSTDTNFDHYNVKACTASNCALGCTSVTTSPTSPVSIVGTANTAYYACVQAQDAAGNLSAWAASLSSLSIDQSAPSVLSVTSSTADGFYKTGDSIDITVKFSEAVTLTNTNQFTFSLDLGTPRSASFASTSGDSVRFTYVVQSGDTTADLEAVDASTSLSKGTGTITDLAGNAADLTLPALGATGSLSDAKAIIVDTTAPTAPTAVAFTGNFTPSTYFAMSWGAGTDSNLSHYEAKICLINDCLNDCTSLNTQASSPTSMTGVRGAEYYGCVRSVDGVGLKSSWTVSSATIKVYENPTSAAVTSGEVLGSFDDGKAKVELTFASAPSGPILSYDVYFSETASIGSIDLNAPIVSITYGDSLLDANPSDDKILVPMPYTLTDGYYLIRYKTYPGLTADTNSTFTSLVTVLRGQPNYQLVPRKFSGLAYDYYIAKYEATASTAGTFGADSISSDATDLANCSYQFHVNRDAFHASCGTMNTSKTLNSTPGSTATVNMTFGQAFTACRNSSTTNALVRLPTYEEWTRASRWIGTTYSAMETAYESNTGSNCYIGSTPPAAGSRTDCKSSLGVFDMAGNNAEFVDRRIYPYTPTPRFSYAPTLGRDVRNGMDNTQSTLDEYTPVAQGEALAMGAARTGSATLYGPSENTWWTTASGSPNIAARCVGFRSDKMPTMSQLSLPDEPKYSSADDAGVASTWTIPENKFYGQNKPETLKITLQGVDPMVAEGDITLSWEPWTKRVCNPTCSTSDNGLSYKIYRFVEPNRVSIRYSTPWALAGAGSIYAADKPLDPLAVDSTLTPLYNTTTQDGKLIATLTNCDAGHKTNCTFTDNDEAGTGFSANKVYNYVLVVEDAQGNKIYPKVRRARGAYQLGDAAMAAKISTRYEPRWRRASVLLIDQQFQFFQPVPQIMAYVPMDKSGLSYDYFIQALEASLASGTIANDSAAASWPLTHIGTSWVSNAGRCEDLFLKTGVLDPTACGDGNGIETSTAVLQSHSGQVPLTSVTQGALWKACRNSGFEDGDGYVYKFRLATDAQWFKAADWGDVDFDGIFDQNNLATGPVVDVEGGTPDSSTARCHTDNDPVSIYNTDDSNTFGCFSRYEVMNMVGNAEEWTSQQVMANDTLADDGVDGSAYQKLLVDVSAAPASAVWDLSTGWPNPSLGSLLAADVSDEFVYLSGAEGGVMRGGNNFTAASGRKSINSTHVPSYSNTWIGGRCTFSQ